MADRTLNVSQLNQFIKRLVEGSAVLKRVVVEGELANCRFAASGHLYFSLKDDSAEISCVMWRSAAAGLKFMPESGMSVRVTGSVQVYAKGGPYQIVATKLEQAGLGAMFLETERLKRELEKKGWFSREIKQELPKEIRRVGIVTSPAGAAIHDIISAVERRNPSVGLLLAPALVQGTGAAQEIARQIERLNEHGGIDVIIVGRGGGSAQDLNAFNELPVLQAIHDSKIPVISAVGHETDVLLSDFTADLRAPTPTAAGELVSADLGELIDRIEMLRLSMTSLIQGRIRELSQQTDLLAERISSASPEYGLLEKQRRCEALAVTLKTEMNTRLMGLRARLERLSEAVTLLDPGLRLEKGWVYVTGEDGRPVVSASRAQTEKQMTLRFADGSVLVRPVEEK